ncbi:hypothetical protein FQN54_004822 [Arachnomyces sp. PD_36]|nr:hypothetical protein FQN54_004822 [Arachnomyces sp. PD_36]
MRIRRVPFSLLLLAHTFFASASVSIPENEVARAPDVSLDNGVQAAPRIVARGNVDAPVDGKDGRPHQGPFVETNADRDRKRSKESNSDSGYGIPEANKRMDGDKTASKEGSKGTEGGVSGKSNSGQMGTGKTPDSPKEPLPLPDSAYGGKAPEYSTKVKNSEYASEKPYETPNDLPKTPHDSSSGSPSSTTPYGATLDHKDGNEIISPMHSLFLSLTMILVSEVGDKTFLVAALMAMRHPRLVVFSAAFSALVVMTVLSAVLGHAVPTLIPKSITNFLAAGLFLVFGAKMLIEARGMAPDENVSEEMKEVEMELEEKETMQRQGRRRSSVTPYNLEAGRARPSRKGRTSTNRLPSPPESISSSSSRESSPNRSMTFSNMASGATNLLALLLSPAWVQTFVMTFLGEWGDRSQIATIAMAAGQDYWWVTAGAIMGHGVCTAAAVIGGRAVAGRVSLRVVTYSGAIAFFVFGFLYFIEAIY